MNEERRIHSDITWEDYRELVETEQVERNRIYFVKDINNYGSLISSLIAEMRALEAELESNRVIEMTQEEFDQIIPDPTKIYKITTISGNTVIYDGATRMAAAYAVGEMQGSLKSANPVIIGNFEVLEG